MNDREDMITQAELKHWLAYNEKSGIFTWVRNPGRFKDKAGTVAGGIMNRGYVLIGLCRKKYLAHRLAWLYVHGRFPDEQIDHKNGNRADNSICNLRSVSKYENQQNKIGTKIKVSGLPRGVRRQSRTGRYEASIKAYGKSYYLGTFTTPELANAAYIEAKNSKHIEQSR